LCACINRAWEEDEDFMNPITWKNMGIEKLSYIFRGETEVMVPMLNERLQVMNEVFW